MTAGTAPATTDRSDFRHILISGTRVGAAVGAAVIVYLLVSRLVPAGIAQAVIQTAVVFAAAVSASLLPAQWTTARSTQGIAGAAAVGLWGTIVFMAIDIIALRPLKAYPWTWDAVGGGSTWWYLPIWWMLGTFVAWMGGLLTAGRAARGAPTSLVALATPVLGGALVVTVAVQLAHLGVYLPIWWMLGTFVAWMGGLLTAGRAARGAPTSLVALATPVLGGALVVTAAVQLAHLGVYLPVAAGAAFTATLTVLAVVAIARRA